MFTLGGMTMTVSRSFMLIGALYLLVGVSLGTYMGGSGDHSLSGVHVHINLLGFASMMLFGLAYRVIPAMDQNLLATIHFWIHQIAVLAFVIILYLFLSGQIDEAGMVPTMPIASMAIILATAVFGWNLYRNGR